ncbi:MAG: glycoside hydrolase family 65 protein, partial [Clostridia bacterium]|nr:glycoside hydrolase family 65 protein [Clostridia bacterium]
EGKYLLSEKQYNIARETVTATYFALSNGYMGIRGSLEESNTVNAQGTYIRGVIGNRPIGVAPVVENEYMKKWYFDEAAVRNYDKVIANVNIADALYLRFFINGECFLPWEGKILSWERKLDMENARLIRDVRWQSPKGDITRFKFERFVSYDDDHLAYIKCTVTPENYDGSITVQSGIDSVSKSSGWRITSRPEGSVCGNRVYYSCLTCEDTGIKAAAGTKTDIYADGKRLELKWSDFDNDGIYASKTELAVTKGQPVVLEKQICFITDRDGFENTEIAVKEVLNKETTYEGSYAKHIKSFKEYFDKMDVDIEGDEKADTALRFSNFVTLGTICRNDSVHSLAPKGLTGPGYCGTVWWDCEVYQSPVFFETMPENGKNLLLYRYRMLDAARRNAKEEGRKGARYPFNSGISGKELVWPVSRHPKMQIHIVSDVAWSINNYYNCTGDDEFMINYGMEMLFEICRYWISRVVRKGRGYEILQVTGTDEQHPYVDNNAYTNYCVAYIVAKTIDFEKKYGTKLTALKEKIKVTDKEIEEFKDLAKNIYLPIDKETGMIPQFDGYFDLSRDLPKTEGSGASLSAYQISTGLYHLSQVIKQPDVLVMFAYQNFKFSPRVYRRNWDYYRARCEALSSLSYSVHSICASDNGEPESAYDYFMKTALMDLDELHGDVTPGIHAACAAGAWMSVIRGIAGVKMFEDRVEIDPEMIPWWKKLSFRVCWHGCEMAIELDNRQIKVIAGFDNDKTVPLIICGERYELKSNDVITKTLAVNGKELCRFHLNNNGAKE